MSTTTTSHWQRAWQVANVSSPNSAEASSSPSPAPSSVSNNAPKNGTLVPNRVFVGGISASTTEQDLLDLFSKYGSVKATKVINDRAGVSKGYGFVTFETVDEARRLTQEADNIVLKDRKLNIAPAVKRQVSDIGYIRQYSPRLVEGPGAVMGAGGTVYFTNGSFGYANQVPVLTAAAAAAAAAHTDPSAATIAAAAAAAQAPPTFPQHAPQAAASAVTVPHTTAQQVPGSQSVTGGYPQTLMYPQVVYFPQQYQQYQPQTIQPQWASQTPQWRWINPSSFSQQPAATPGYITSDGIYAPTQATYIVPDRSY